MGFEQIYVKKISTSKVLLTWKELREIILMSMEDYKKFGEEYYLKLKADEDIDDTNGC